MTERLSIIFRLDEQEQIRVEGRVAWTLLQLIEAGKVGCTPIERPAPRWSDYVFQLRALGVGIETILEKHAGPFPGNHGRYILRSSVELLSRNGESA